MQRTKICFIGFFPDYEHYFFKSLNSEEFDVRIFNPLDKTSNINWFKWLPRLFRNIWHKQLIRQYINANIDEIFIFNEHRLLLQGILSAINRMGSQSSQFTGYLLLRNPLNERDKTFPLIQELEQKGVQVSTFDYADSCKFKFSLYSQFCSIIPELENVTQDYDFSFVGRDKGRGDQLLSLKKQLESLNAHTFFDIRTADQANLTYLEYLGRSLSGKCMVEFLQSGQSGMTLRAIEALLYKRKLLTTNQSIVREAFYHPANIYVFDERTLDTQKLQRFMAEPWHPIDVEIQQAYTTEHVIKKLIAK